tara:strand:+ start:229 stop:402 length:174 start_codon:yes stop_codon:yes gene_type:complete
MSKTTIVIIIYIIGLIFGALFLKIWSADTSVLKGLIGLGWTALLLIGLFFAEKDERN